MTRTKNASFVGALPSVVEPDAPTFKRVIKDVFGDQALVWDKLTGQNGETNTIIHTGAPRGARLGMPYIVQGCPDARGYPLASLFVDAPAASGHGALGETLVFGVPIYIPTGETDLSIAIYGEALNVYPWRYELTSSTDITTPIAFGSLEVTGNPGNQAATASFSSDAIDGALRLLLIYCDTSQQLTEYSAAGTRLWSLIVAPWRIGDPVSIPHQASSSIVGVTAPALNETLPFTQAHDAWFSNGYPLHSWLTGQANRNASGMLEYLTGWPAHGNSAYTHVDATALGAPDTTDPAVPRFHSPAALYGDGSSVTANGLNIPMPLHAQAFGAFLTSGSWAVGDGTGSTGEPPAAGMLGWYAPWPVAVTTQTAAQAVIQYPDAPTGGSSKLAVAVLVGTNGKSMANWTVSVTNGVGTGSGTPTVITGSTSRLALMTASAVDFTADAALLTQIRTAKSSARGGPDDICVLGFCLYFAP